MCFHVLNAQVAVRAQCCRKWYDCPQCHSDKEDHPLKKSSEIVMACKQCRKTFRLDGTKEPDESDEYCPHCDNHFVLEAKTPEAMLQMDADDIRMNGKLLKDERIAR